MPQFDNSVTPSGEKVGASSGMGKYKWYIVGTIIGLAVIMFIRSRGASTSTAGASAPNPTGTTGVDSAGQTSLDQINQALGDLNNNLTNTNAGDNADPAPPAKPGYEVGAMSGLGYMPKDMNVAEVTSQGTFNYLRSGQQAEAVGLQNVYWQPSAGSFLKYNPTVATVGSTPLFYKSA